ncbi:MAG: BrnA antitoxin family protein [Kistimonas sp.]|nr:BrnA antitoxin family protein [Kistimonas sp.]
MNTGPDQDNPEWTDDEVARSLSFPDLDPGLQDRLSNSRAASRQETSRTRISVRLSKDVLDFFRASGKGWQIRMDKVLRDYVKSQG